VCLARVAWPPLVRLQPQERATHTPGVLRRLHPDQEVFGEMMRDRGYGAIFVSNERGPSPFHPLSQRHPLI